MTLAKQLQTNATTPADPRPKVQTLSPDAHIVIGMILHHIPTAKTFRVLCNCPSATPRHHTLRQVQQNRSAYRYATPEELADLTRQKA